MVDSGDPLGRVKMVVAYSVCAMWVAVFIVALIHPPEDTTQLLAVQTTMMAVVGALFADRWLRKNGRNGNGD